MMLLGPSPDLCPGDTGTATATSSSSGHLASILRLFRLRPAPIGIEDGDPSSKKINGDNVGEEKIKPSLGCSLCSGNGNPPKRENATNATRTRRKKRSRSPTHNNNNNNNNNNNIPASSTTQCTQQPTELESLVESIISVENIVHCALITIVTVIVYYNAVHGDFVHDDVAAIVTNKDVLGKSNLLNLLHNDFWGMDIKDRRSHKSYRPLTVLTFRLTHAIFGLNPVPFHVGNLVLHIGITLLTHHVARSYLNVPSGAALVAALLFAVHPVHTEAVTGVVGRADLLSTLFLLLTFIVAQRCWERVGLVTMMALLATLSKETGVMSLPIVVLFRLCQRQDILSKEGGRTGLKYFSITLAMVICRLGLNGSSPIFSEQDNPAAFAATLPRVLTYCYLPANAINTLLFPNNLSYDWQLGSLPLLHSILDLRNLATIAAILPGICLLHKSAVTKRPALVFSTLTLILPFLPASNLFFPVGFVAAERTLYTSSIGWCLLVAIGLHQLYAHLSDKKIFAVKVKVPKVFQVLLLVLPLLVLLLAGAAKTVLRNQVWESRETLFRSGLSSAPRNGKVFYNFGNFLRDQEQKDEARLCYKEALRLWPTYVIAMNNLATVTDNESDIEDLLLRALSLDPGHATSLFNLADLYRQQGRCSAARAYFSLCLATPDCLPEADLLSRQCGDGIQEARDVGSRHHLDHDGTEELEVWEACSNQSVPGSDCRRG